MEQQSMRLFLLEFDVADRFFFSLLNVTFSGQINTFLANDFYIKRARMPYG